MKRRSHYQQRRADADGYTIKGENGLLVDNPIWDDWDEGTLHIRPDEEGWIPFYATEDSVCPVDNGQIVDIDTKITGLRKQYKTECWHWSNIWSNNVPSGDIITRYRLVEKNCNGCTYNPNGMCNNPDTCINYKKHTTDPFFFDPDEETRLTEQNHDEADYLIDLWKDSQLELNFED
jgi:hypothetical protein